MLQEKKQLATALAESKREHECMLKDNLCDTMDDLMKKIKLPVSWHATFKNGVQYIYKIEPFSENKAPTMDPVVFIDEELHVNVFVKLNTIDGITLPARITSLQTIYKILDGVEKLLECANVKAMPASLQQNTLSVVLVLILSLLAPFKDKVENYGNAIWFICEQLTLILNKKRYYSAELSSCQTLSFLYELVLIFFITAITYISFYFARFL